MASRKFGASVKDREDPRSVPFSSVIRLLAGKGIITRDQFAKLSEVTKMRNLVSHCQMEKIDSKQSINLDELICIFKNL
ncbi:hypothetical protein BCL90_5174 [Pedobacter alluvionis]|uniref:DUF4145 domain-containing protein n=1 Tax=Pedobacter alluvionis TaxID=475253 RepID=A0A497XN69_9SPHI|nr:hypothetical protein BCL90_5174 [Pedobacter alluvionis]